MDEWSHKITVEMYCSMTYGEAGVSPYHVKGENPTDAEFMDRSLQYCRDYAMKPPVVENIGKNKYGSGGVVLVSGMCVK